MGQGLLKALNLQRKPGANKAGDHAAGKANDLTDRDFMADTRRRPAADRDALRKGQERAKEAREAPGDGPEKDPIDAAVDKKVDEIMKDAGKRAQAFAEKGIPTFSDVYQSDTDYDRFLADLKSGTEQAKKYVDYIKQVADYAQKTGDVKALAPIARVAKNLGKISSTISTGLKSFSGKLDTARKIAKWCEALADFAVHSEAMSTADRESVAEWVKSMERLWNATVPFIEWLKSEAFEAALGGSEAAGAASATLAIVGAELFIGIKALDAGVHNVNAYFDKMDERLAEIDGKAPKQAPRPPEAPGDWSTRKEIQESFGADEKSQLRRKLLQEENARRSDQAEHEAADRERFDSEVLPGLYMKGRKLLRDRVYAEYRKADGDPKSVAAEWWNCFRPVDGPVEVSDEPSDPDAPISLDDRDEFDIPKIKESIDLQDAKDEVVSFLNLAHPCKHFLDLREALWKHQRERRK